ncbi:MAG: hypothetical protein ACFB11_17225 [Paracoccaceae bacterium]
MAAPKSPFNRITNPDGSPVRDKHNAMPKHKPDFAKRPAPNLAPGGAMGIRQGLATSTENQHDDKHAMPEITEAGIASGVGIETDNHYYTDGRLVTMPGYSFLIRVTNEPTKDGIGGGKIDQLVLKKDNQIVARYNHGWDIDPRTPADKEALQRALLHKSRLGFIT